MQYEEKGWMNFGTKWLSQPLTQPTRTCAWTPTVVLVWTTPSPTTKPRQVETTLLAVASDCTENVNINIMGLRSIISHRRWEMDGFLKHKPMQCVGRGHLKPSCWREVDASPILDPATGGVEWMGEKGRSHAAPYCWITGDGKAVGFGCRLITCLCSSWFTQAVYWTLSKGGPALRQRGCPSCPCTHMHMCPHIVPKGLLESTA